MNKFDARVFSTLDEKSAKDIILTPEAGLSTNERWIQETAWVLPKLIFPEGLILDYGCGIGRIAKKLSQSVLGVDISMTMRRNAETYVSRNEFGAVHPNMFESLIKSGLKFDGAYTFWVLQHVEDPERTVELIYDALFDHAPLYVINRLERVVPTTEGWKDDDIQVVHVLAKHFDLVSGEEMPYELCEPGACFAHWMKK